MTISEKIVVFEHCACYNTIRNIVLSRCLLTVRNEIILLLLISNAAYSEYGFLSDPSFGHYLELVWAHLNEMFLFFFFKQSGGFTIIRRLFPHLHLIYAPSRSLREKVRYDILHPALARGRMS